MFRSCFHFLGIGQAKQLLLSNDVLEVNVSTLSGNNVTIQLPRFSSMAELLGATCQHLSVPAERIKLILGATPLAIYGSLDDAGIVTGSHGAAVVVDIARRRKPPSRHCQVDHASELCIRLKSLILRKF